jgi:hypothetical protein
VKKSAKKMPRPDFRQSGAALHSVANYGVASLKMAPTVASVVDNVIVQLLGPSGLRAGTLEQFEDHPPNLTPVWAGAVKVTVVFMG